MRRFLTMLAAWLALGVGAARAETPVTVVSSAEARAIARQALADGRPEIADAMSSALLAKDPKDAEALLIRAFVLRAAGQTGAAAEASAAAWRHAKAPALRYDAAMLTADLLAREEKYTRAQFWLRRADQAASDPGRRAAAAEAYRAVSQRNPLQIALRFSIKPSNNVNNGAETLVVDIAGLPFRLDSSGQQLGGWEASTGLSFGYRLAESPTARTDLLGEVFFRKVWLEPEAATVAPGARDSDYDYGAVVGGVRHQRLIWPKLGPSAITGVVGQSWYGGSALARWGEVQLGQTVVQGDAAALRFGLQARVEQRLDDDINDSRTLGLSVEYLRALGANGGYSLGASVRRIWSESATVDGVAIGVSGSRSFGRIGPVVPRISLQGETRDYQKWAATAGGREDHTLSLLLDVTWPDVSYYGFAPQATLTARRTWSNVDIYDRNEVSLGFTAVSRF